MYQRVDLAVCKCLLQSRRILILPDFRVRNTVPLHIFIKLLLPHISLYNAVGNIPHSIKILVGNPAVSLRCDCAEGIAAGEIGILVKLLPLFGKLRGPDQINFLFEQQRKRLVPAGTVHVFDIPVYVCTQRLEIFHVHAARAAVAVSLVKALHREKADPHRAPASVRNTGIPPGRLRPASKRKFQNEGDGKHDKREDKRSGAKSHGMKGHSVKAVFQMRCRRVRLQ